MGLISLSLPTDGTTADVADVNTPLNTIANEFNGNIDNTNIKTGAAIDGSKLADASVTNAKLSTAAGELGGAWQSWTPTWTNLSVGNGTVIARYTQVGKTVCARLVLTGGSTTTHTGVVSFSLPAAAQATGLSGFTTFAGTGWIDDAGVQSYACNIADSSSTTARILILVTSAAYANYAIWNTGVPFTFGNLDTLTCSFFYEAA